MNNSMFIKIKNSRNISLSQLNNYYIQLIVMLLIPLPRLYGLKDVNEKIYCLSFAYKTFGGNFQTVHGYHFLYKIFKVNYNIV